MSQLVHQYFPIAAARSGTESYPQSWTQPCQRLVYRVGKLVSLPAGFPFLLSSQGFFTYLGLLVIPLLTVLLLAVQRQLLDFASTSSQRESCKVKF